MDVMAKPLMNLWTPLDNLNFDMLFFFSATRRAWFMFVPFDRTHAHLLILDLSQLQ
jgi:hypothetical protein